MYLDISIITLTIILLDIAIDRIVAASQPIVTTPASFFELKTITFWKTQNA